MQRRKKHGFLALLAVILIFMMTVPGTVPGALAASVPEAGESSIEGVTMNPESASGRAILAVQQASQAPMNEQKESYKNFVEDIAKIDLEYLVAYSEDGINMEETVSDPMSGEEYTKIINIPHTLTSPIITIIIPIIPIYTAVAIVLIENNLNNKTIIPIDPKIFLTLLLLIKK